MNVQHYILFLVFFSHSVLSSATFNILTFGAKSNGRTDSSNALHSAWSHACSSRKPASITIPKGRFLIKGSLLLQGPCNNNAVSVLIKGTLLAPTGYSQDESWITFKYVKGLSIVGGTIDAQGQSLWRCKASSSNCPAGSTSLRIGESSNVHISGVTLLNSEMFHMVIFGSNHVTVQGVSIQAPGNSPNTDGIHIQKSSNVNILGSTVKTGDDCVSMGEGVTNVWIEKVNCGPGHGISIGSLGDSPQEDGVQNITVKSVVFTGTQNGLRIKTWGKPNPGFVSGVTFQHAVMRNVQNPIMIDQNYCPGDINCPNQNSGVRISKVSFTDIQGSSATPIAIKLDCSPTNPCKGMGLRNIKLTYGKNAAKTYCRNVHGREAGFVIPSGCL